MAICLILSTREVTQNIFACPVDRFAGRPSYFVHLLVSLGHSFRALPSLSFSRTAYMKRSAFARTGCTKKTLVHSRLRSGIVAYVHAQ